MMEEGSAQKVGFINSELTETRPLDSKTKMTTRERDFLNTLFTFL